MANSPHPDKVSVRVQLWRDLRDRVQARAEANGETMTELVVRALEAELDR